MRVVASLALLGALIASAHARADAITMPPSCPESSEDAFCHGPPTCRPRGCIASTDCNTGEHCSARSLCIEAHMCFGLGTPTSIDHVLGDCDAAGACPGGGTCQSDFVCVPGTVSTDAGHDASMDGGAAPEHVTACACRAGSAGGGGLAMLGALALVLAVARRRSTR